MTRLSTKAKLNCRSPLTLTTLILKKLAELGEATIDSFFPEKYPEARIWRNLLGFESGRSFKKASFSALLCRLRSQGLVVRRGSRKNSVWRLTDRGRNYIFNAGESPRSANHDGIKRIVIFDIPEKERAKRNAIRLELASAGFEQLQKSVWLGEKPLPQDFLELVDELRLRPHIHIFSIREPGTLS